MPLGRVLVVDDEEAVGAVLRDLLLAIGYDVQNAARGAQALELVEVFQPDVILLDLQMPEMPGTEVLARLRARHPKVPVIIVTANEDIAIATGTLAAGAFDYVLKPCTLEGLERIVGAALGQEPA